MKSVLLKLPYICEINFRNCIKNTPQKILTSRFKRKKNKTKPRKGKLKNEEESQSEQSSSKTQWKELRILESKTGLNPLLKIKKLTIQALKRTQTRLWKSGILKRLELNKQLATRELSVKTAKVTACHNSVKAKKEAKNSQVDGKKKKPAWAFEAKKRWETKSDMGYM